MWNIFVNLQLSNRTVESKFVNGYRIGAKGTGTNIRLKRWGCKDI